MPFQKLIRRRPLSMRIKAYLDPRDILLWLSEEIDSSEWDQWSKAWGNSIGIGLNILLLFARANMGGTGGRVVDDVFSDEVQQLGWAGWMVCSRQQKSQLLLLWSMTSDMTASGVGIVHCTLPFLPRATKLIVRIPPPTILSSIRNPI